MLKGKRLQPGDTIGVIGPSGAVRKEGAVDEAVAYIKELGYQVKLGESAHARYGYLSGTDEVRARDLCAMFADPQVDAIVCTRGGYGTMRMLDMLDYDVIRANPKVFVGFSDITALHIAFLEKCGLVTFHGPMATRWKDEFPDGFTQDALARAVTKAQPLGNLVNAPGYHARQTVNSGCAEGMLVGGNLSLIAGTIGTPYELDTKGRILFIEEIGERTYCVDRMLTQLRLAGKFEDCAGIVFGDFSDCPVEYPEFGLTLEEVIRDIAAPCGKPIFTGLQAGHVSPKITLPFGVQCRMDADACTLEILEAAVIEA
ncbi:MAG: LD-carboxypeptidase [Clostridia bacterium]|nr:LD-carboxypeptidase [Clostridia bacterium]